MLNWSCCMSMCLLSVSLFQSVYSVHVESPLKLTCGSADRRAARRPGEKLDPLITGSRIR